MNILVINDDGIKTTGLKVLVEALKPLGNIYIFAPEHHQSGKSQSLTIRKNIKIKDYKNLYGAKRAYSAYGTPADCVRLALFIFKDIKFDFVASGINSGANLGSDVLRSGTLGAASEAVCLGLKGIALSSPYEDFKMAEVYTTKLVKELLENDLLSNKYCLNINYPAKEFTKPKGIKFTTQGYHAFKPKFRQARKNAYYPIYESYNLVESEDSDVFGYLNGYITITPVFEDRSRKEHVESLNKKSKLNELLNCDKINLR